MAFVIIICCVLTAQGVISRACRAVRARLVLLCEWVREETGSMHAGFVATRDELKSERGLRVADSGSAL